MLILSVCQSVMFVCLCLSADNSRSGGECDRSGWNFLDRWPASGLYWLNVEHPTAWGRASTRESNLLSVYIRSYNNELPSFRHSKSSWGKVEGSTVPSGSPRFFCSDIFISYFCLSMIPVCSITFWDSCYGIIRRFLYIITSVIDMHVLQFLHHTARYSQYQRLVQAPLDRES